MYKRLCIEIKEKFLVSPNVQATKVFYNITFNAPK